MNNSFFIRAGDLVELNIPDTRLNDKIDTVCKVSTERNMIGVHPSVKSMATTLRKYGLEVTTIDKELFVKLDHNDEIAIISGTDEYEFSIGAVRDTTFGFVIENNDHPFIMYLDGKDLVYKPFETVSEDIKGVYRHYILENELVRSRLIYNFLMPDLIKSYSEESGNYVIADRLPGNSGLNYAMLILGFSGASIPDSWVESGAPKEFVTDNNFGFRRVML